VASFEKDAGDILKAVQMLERHLVKSGVFDSTSQPSIEQLEEALSETEAEMFAWLGGAGFSIVITDYPTLAKEYLTWFAALGTAYRLELSLPGVQYNARGNSRWQVLKGEYNTLRKIVEDNTLDRLGVVRTREALSVITGTSHDDKKAITTDTDAVQPVFCRDIFDNPARLRSSKIYSES